MLSKIDDFIVTEEWAINNRACNAGVRFLNNYFPNGGTCKDVLNKCMIMGEWQYSNWLIRKLEIANVTIPKRVMSIGVEAFNECTSLISINIPDSVTNISIYAFFNCLNLTYIVIPDSVRYVSEYAFIYCQNMKNIIIPRKLKIKYNFFSNCSAKIIKYGEYRWVYNFKKFIKGE